MMSPKRLDVLGFTPSLGGGGAEMSLLRLLNGLDRGRFRPAVAVARGGGAYGDYLRADVERHVLCRGALWSSTGRLLRALPQLRRLIRRERPDVVVSVMDHTNVTLLLAVRGIQPCPKVVLSVQNNPRVKYGGDRVSLLKRAIFFFMKRLYARADRIVAISRGVEKELVTLVPSVQGHTEVIYNAGVDETVLRKAQQAPEGAPSRAPGEKLVVACGRFTEQKGFSHLLDAFARVHEEMPAQLWVLGEGKKRVALEEQTRRLGIADDVWMPGFVDNPYSYMAAADVFVLSSLWEGFGNVVAEAMACGTAVVTTDCPHGPAEIVEGGESGVLVPPADPVALAEAVKCLLDDDEKRAHYAAVGKERAHDFAAGRIAASHGELFERVAQLRPHSSI